MPVTRNFPEAFDMAMRLNRVESIIAGPSSSMALCGALKIIADEPDALVVVIFPDNAFKYASSFARHFPNVAAAPSDAEPAAGPSPKELLLDSLVKNSRNPHDTVEVSDVQEMLNKSNKPLLVDVRGAGQYRGGHLPGAVNIPVAEIAGRHAELPVDLDAPMVTVCNLGNASISGMLVLKSLGYRNVKSLKGGTVAWKEQGLPTE
jgi:rhodanese-related sulfurtransferase